MKRILLSLAFLAIAVSAQALALFEEGPIEFCGNGYTLVPSTSAWTQETRTLVNLDWGNALPARPRSGMRITVPSGNTAGVAVIISSSTVIPPEAITVQTEETEPGEKVFIHAGPNVRVWFLGLFTSTESIHIQNCGQ